MERGLLTKREMNSLTNGGQLPARSHADRVRCIVIEAGASWLTPVSDGFDETIVVTQTAGELPAVFAQRVMARVAGVEPAQRRLESLSLLLGDRQDRASIVARRLIVLGLAAHPASHVRDRDGANHVAPVVDDRHVMHLRVAHDLQHTL